jgi:ELWxxDGT repeat protein
MKFWSNRSIFRSRRSVSPRRSRRPQLEWCEDRTLMTVSLVAEIAPGADSGNPSDFVELNGILYFGAEPVADQQQLYSYNPATNAITKLSNFVNGSTTSSVFRLYAFNNEVFFAAVNTGASNNISAFGTSSAPGNVGLELFKYSPATQTVSLVADIDPGGFDLGTSPPSYANSSNAARFYAFQGKMYFTADNGTNGSEMWVYNPGTGGVSLFKEFNPGAVGGSPNHFTEVGGKLLVSAYDSSYPLSGFTAVANEEFWVYDPGTNGFTKFELNPSATVQTAGSNPLEDRAVIGTKIYFGAESSTSNQSLWVWDAATPGTAPTRVGPEINAGPNGDGFTDFTVLGGKLYFRANDGDAAVGDELWRFDPATNTTVNVFDINPGTADSFPGELTVFGGKIYFGAESAAFGDELWVHDPTANTTTRLTDINPGTADSGPSGLTIFNGKLYFSARSDTTGRELYVLDPATNAVSLVLDINPGTGNGSPSGFTEAGGNLYFQANGGTTIGRELYVLAGPVTNTAPTISAIGNQTINEDASTGALAFTIGDAQTAAGSLTVTVASSNTTLIPNANVTLGGSGANRTVTVTPAANRNGGPVTITVTVSDGSLSAVETFTVTVNAVNDAPSFSTLGNRTVLEDAGSQTVTGFATPAPGGGPDEAGQTFTYGVSNNNPNLFSVQPAIAANGTLTFTPSPNVNGSATVTVSVTDSGGTANGGVATSGTQTFTITVTPVNDAPSIGAIADRTINEDASTGAISFSVADIDTAVSSLVVTATSSNTAIIPNGNIVLGGSGSSRTVTVTPAANQNGGPVTISVTVSDGSLSASETFTVTVNSVNDAPSFTAGTNVTVLEDSGAYAAAWASAISAGPANESGQTVSFNVANDNNALFSVQPSIAADGTLTFTPAANANGSATVTVSVTDSGGTANGGVDTSGTQTFTINVNSVNDAPSFTTLGNQSVLEDAGVQSVTGFASAAAGGGADESGQTFTYGVSNDNNALFSVQPAIAADGTLTFTPAANANGSVTVTVSVTDSGGTANGGVDTSGTQTFTISVTSVNDAPVGANATVTTLEDTVYVFALADFGFTDPNDAPANGFLAVTIATLPAAGSLQLNGVAVSAGQSITVGDIAASKLRFLPAANANGAGYASFTFQVQDDGGTANGGSDLDATPRTLTIDVTAVNDAPVNTVPGAQTAAEDAPLAITGLSIADLDAGTGTVQVTLAVSNGKLTLRTDVPGGLTAASLSGNGTNSVTLTGTVAQIYATLAATGGLVYLGNANYSGADLLTVTTNDLGNTGLGGPLVDIDTVAISVLSATQQAQNLVAQVNALVTAGTLNGGQGNSLTTKLKNVTNTRGANQVRAFINHLTDLVRTGVLTQAQADPLLAAAQLILLSLA